MSYVLPLLVVGATALGVHNVFADPSRVEEMGRATACQGEGPKCRAQPTRVMRTPFFQDLQFRAGKKTTDVRCARSFYLAGDYACAVTGRKGP